MDGRSFEAHWLGRKAYEPIHELQKELLQARIAGEIPDTLLLLEHEATITLGRGADGTNIVATKEQLETLGISVHETGRGGDVTYHGPGQLVAYPIFDLRPDRCDVRKYVGDLVRVMALLAAEYGIGAGPHSKLIGCWVETDAPTKPWPGELQVKHPGKLGAIGVKLSHWVTMHGFAFNASTALSHFELIVPCGIKEHPVVTLASLGVDPVPTVHTLAGRVVEHFEHVFSSRCSRRVGF